MNSPQQHYCNELDFSEAAMGDNKFRSESPKQ
jgi:hypothetical protein